MSSSLGLVLAVLLLALPVAVPPRLLGRSKVGEGGERAGKLANPPLPLPPNLESTSTTSFHRRHGHSNLKSTIMRPPNASSFGRSNLLYRTTTTLPALGLSTGRPRAVLIPNWAAPPRRSNRLASASDVNLSHAAAPDWKTRPGRPHPVEKENFSEYRPKRDRSDLASGGRGRRLCEAPPPGAGLPCSSTCTPTVTLPPKQRRRAHCVVPEPSVAPLAALGTHTSTCSNGTPFLSTQLAIPDKKGSAWRKLGSSELQTPEESSPERPPRFPVELLTLRATTSSTSSSADRGLRTNTPSWRALPPGSQSCSMALPIIRARRRARWRSLSSSRRRSTSSTLPSQAAPSNATESVVQRRAKYSRHSRPM